MGVKDFLKFMEEIGYAPNSANVSGARIGLDAMCLVYIFSFYACKDHNSIIIPLRQRVPDLTEENLNTPKYYEIIDALSSYTNEDGEYLDVRESVYQSFATYCRNITYSTNTPVLIWDSPVWGKPRSDGKIQRPDNGGFKFRTIDITYIALKLLDDGIRSYFSYGDGERTGAYQQMEGYLDYLMTTDTDPICMRCDNVCTFKNVRFHPGKHMEIGYIHYIDRVLRYIKKLNPILTNRIIYYIAMFLGNDYTRRKYGNGKAKLIKVLSSDDFEPCMDDIIDDDTTTDEYNRAMDFFKCEHDRSIYVKRNTEIEESIKAMYGCIRIIVVGCDLDISIVEKEMAVNNTIYLGPYVDDWHFTRDKYVISKSTKRIITIPDYLDKVTKKLDEKGIDKIVSNEYTKSDIRDQ